MMCPYTGIEVKVDGFFEPIFSYDNTPDGKMVIAGFQTIGLVIDEEGNIMERY